jgi:hypothetical protein
MRLFNGLVLSALLILPGVPAGAQHRKAPHPDAPAEMKQFAFLVGEWDCKFRYIGADGEHVEATGRWVGYYSLDGFAFQDDWHSTLNRGTTWRTYDPEKERWVNRWLPANTDRASGFTTDYFYGGMQDGEMVLTAEGSDGRGAFTDRIVFTDIREDGFTWKLDRSRDGGKTWVRDVMVNEAKRAR